MSQIGPTDQLMNCKTWAHYESPGSTPTASLCSGGKHEGLFYDECPSMADCKAATLRANDGCSLDGRRYQQSTRNLPVINNRERPFGSQLLQGTSFGRQPPPPQQQQPQQQQQVPNNLFRQWNFDQNLPTNIKQAQGTPPNQARQALVTPMQLNSPVPFPVQPPQEWPRSMHTPYVAPSGYQGGGITPTFLPEPGEGTPARLAKNIAQGMLGSAGWHIFDYMRSVDIFK